VLVGLDTDVCAAADVCRLTAADVDVKMFAYAHLLHQLS